MPAETVCLRGRRGFCWRESCPNVATVIVTCPNCATRYRLAAAAADAVAAGKRMKCAECGHRWQPATAPAPPPIDEDIDEDEELAAVEAESAARPSLPRQPVAPPPADEPAEPPPPEPAVAEPQSPEDEEPRGRPVIKTLAALVIGTALGVAAAGLWIGDLDPARLPFVADRLGLAVPPPLAVTVSGRVTRLGSGERLLEVSGTITNPGPERVAVPVLRAVLADANGIRRSWKIAPPTASIGPGGSIAFASTLANVPEAATILRVGSRLSPAT